MGHLPRPRHHRGQLGRLLPGRAQGRQARQGGHRAGQVADRPRAAGRRLQGRRCLPVQQGRVPAGQCEERQAPVLQRRPDRADLRRRGQLHPRGRARCEGRRDQGHHLHPDQQHGAARHQAGQGLEGRHRHHRQGDRLTTAGCGRLHRPPASAPARGRVPAAVAGAGPPGGAGRAPGHGQRDPDRRRRARQDHTPTGASRPTATSGGKRRPGGHQAPGRCPAGPDPASGPAGAGPARTSGRGAGRSALQSIRTRSGGTGARFPNASFAPYPAQTFREGLPRGNDNPRTGYQHPAPRRLRRRAERPRRMAQPAVALRRPRVAVRLHRPLLPRLRRLRALPAPLYRVDRPAPGGDDEPEPVPVGRLRQLLQDPPGLGVLDGGRQHLRHRRPLHRPAAPRGARARPPAQLQAARQHVLADGHPHPVRHLGGHRRAGLRPGLPGRRRRPQLGAALLRRGQHRLGQRGVDLEDSHLGHRDLALDRIQRADLPRRHAGGAQRAVRGRLDRRGDALAAVPQGDDPLAAAHDPVHHRHLDDRLHAAVR
ncbi:putative ATP-dependent protease La Type I [Streptomyces misionensis JCM 4497]